MWQDGLGGVGKLFHSLELRASARGLRLARPKPLCSQEPTEQERGSPTPRLSTQGCREGLAH